MLSYPIVRAFHSCNRNHGFNTHHRSRRPPTSERWTFPLLLPRTVNRRRPRTRDSARVSLGWRRLHNRQHPEAARGAPTRTGRLLGGMCRGSARTQAGRCRQSAGTWRGGASTHIQGCRMEWQYLVAAAVGAAHLSRTRRAWLRSRRSRRRSRMSRLRKPFDHRHRPDAEEARPRVSLRKNWRPCASSVRRHAPA